AGEGADPRHRRPVAGPSGAGADRVGGRRPALPRPRRADRHGRDPRGPGARQPLRADRRRRRRPHRCAPVPGPHPLRSHRPGRRRGPRHGHRPGHRRHPRLHPRLRARRGAGRSGRCPRRPLLRLPLPAPGDLAAGVRVRRRHHRRPALHHQRRRLRADRRAGAAVRQLLRRRLRRPRRRRPAGGRRPHPPRRHRPHRPAASAPPPGRPTHHPYRPHRRRHGMTATRTPRTAPAAPPAAKPAAPPPPGGPLRRLRPLTLPAAVLLVLALLPYSSLSIPFLLDGPVNSPGSLQLFALCLVFAGLAAGYDLMFGRTGLLSFGHALYIAGGAYGTQLAMTELGLGLVPAALLTLVLGTCAAVVLGAISLRTLALGGVGFAMVTLAFAQAGAIWVERNPGGLTGGEEGLPLYVDAVPAALTGVANTANLYWQIGRAACRGRV